MSDDDTEPDDAQLRALRSVWLSLPDEDPPSAGLAELMAAARARAELLAQPPWWRRLFVQLRKPPVLAFATLLVVIGGAIAIGRRGDTIDPAAPVTAPAAPATGTYEAPAGDPVRSKESSSAPGGGGGQSLKGESDTGGEAQHAAGSAPVTQPADGKANAIAVPPMKLAPTAHHSAPSKKPSYAPTPELQPSLQVAPDTNGPSSDTAPVADHLDDNELKKDTAKPPALQAAATADTPAPVGDRKHAPTPDDLAAQARAAAARGDCTQANAISARVSGRQSRQLAADPAIAKCAAK